MALILWTRSNWKVPINRVIRPQEDRAVAEWRVDSQQLHEPGTSAVRRMNRTLLPLGT